MPGVSAASAATAGISSAVNSSRQVNEKKPHNQEMENIAKQQSGSGIISDTVASIPLVGKQLSDALKKIGLGNNFSVKNLKGVAYGGGLFLEREGNGLFLERQGK